MKGLRDNPILDDCQKVLMRCSKLEIDDKNRQIIGIIESGLYGNASTLANGELEAFLRHIFRMNSQNTLATTISILVI